MASSHCAALAAYKDFQVRVDYFLKKQAVAVMGEDEATDNHANRVLFSRDVLRGRVSLYDIALAVTTNGTVSATIGTNDEPTSNAAIIDNDLSYVVQTEMYDAFSER